MIQEKSANQISLKDCKPEDKEDQLKKLSEINKEINLNRSSNSFFAGDRNYLGITMRGGEY